MLFFTIHLLNGERMSTQDAATFTDDFMQITRFCETFGFAYSTVSKYIHLGEIALHQFSDERRPKINVAEALRVMSAIKRPYTAPDLRIVRHDQAPVKTEIKKVDLFG
jgi:hypothetical protein